MQLSEYAQRLKQNGFAINSVTRENGDLDLNIKDTRTMGAPAKDVVLSKSVLDDSSELSSTLSKSYTDILSTRSPA